MSERHFYIDRLRVLAVLLLFPFHAAWSFTPFRPYVQHDPSSEPLIAFVGFVHQWHMQLFFILAGMSTYFALGKRSPGQYLVERLRRLLVPAVFGTLVVVPPLVWCRHVSSDPDSAVSYWEWYPQFFDGVAPAGNFEWSHLWFMVYLLTFSLLALPLLWKIRTGALARPVAWLAGVCQRRCGLLALALPMAVFEAVFRPGWPGLQNLTDDWANFTVYLSYFVYGCLLCSHQGFLQALDRDWKIFRVLAIAGMLVFYAMHGLKLLSFRYTPGYIAFEFFRGVDSWIWVLFLVGWARARLDSGSRFLDYAREAALPYYVLHHTPVMLLALLLLDLGIPIGLKWVLIFGGAFLVVLPVYEVLVRRVLPVRVMLGMRARR